MLLVAMNQGAGPRSPTVARLHLKGWGSMLLGLATDCAPCDTSDYIEDWFVRT